jgi:hypothetical protein
MGSTQIRSRDNGPKARPFFSYMLAPHCTLCAPPARQEISQQRQRHRPRVALVEDVPGADELGRAITLPLEPDADLDADEADTNNEGVDEAKERLVGVAAAVWNCCTRAWRRRLRRDRQSCETGRRRCGYGLGSSGESDYLVGVEGRCEEVCEQGIEGRTEDEASTHLERDRTSSMQRGRCSLHPKITIQFPPVDHLVALQGKVTLHDNTCRPGRRSR